MDLLLAVMFALGLACIVAGVMVLWGLGWALVAGGMGLLVYAALLSRGLR